jgi:predicted ArsR family transcriptional regulator
MDDRFAAIGALADPNRRVLYDYVVREGRPVNRDEAAEAAGLPRATAAFHLDRMVADGLLEAEYRRLSGRRGPGAGRPSKLYRRSAREIAVSLPPRCYDLAGHLLASAVTDSARTGEPVDQVLERQANAQGARMGAGRPRRSRPTRATLAGILAEHGYEPQLVGRRIVLANCPFHALVEDHRQLVCGMNLALLNGVLDGAGAERWTAAPDPSPGRCCVTVAPRKDQ